MASNSTWGSRNRIHSGKCRLAVGLGAFGNSIILAGNNGGSVFLLSYLLFTFTVGVAMLISEYVIGREGRMGAIGSLKKVVGKHWGVFGTVGVVIAFAILLLLFLRRRLVYQIFDRRVHRNRNCL